MTSVANAGVEIAIATKQISFFIIAMLPQRRGSTKGPTRATQLGVQLTQHGGTRNVLATRLCFSSRSQAPSDKFVFRSSLIDMLIEGAREKARQGLAFVACPSPQIAPDFSRSQRRDDCGIPSG